MQIGADTKWNNDKRAKMITTWEQNCPNGKSCPSSPCENLVKDRLREASRSLIFRVEADKEM